MSEEFVFDKDVKRETLLVLKGVEAILPEVIKKIEQSEENNLANGVSCGNSGINSGSTTVTIFPDGYSDDLMIPQIRIKIDHKRDERDNILSEGRGISFDFFDLYKHTHLKKEKSSI